MKIRALFILLTLSLLLSSTAPSAYTRTDTTLRVCVLKDATVLTLTIKGYYRILALNTNEVLKNGRNLKAAKVLPTLRGLEIGGEAFDIYGVRIVSKRDASIYIGRRSFRGTLDIIRTEEKNLLAINHVDIEDYLKGVLYHEVSHWWPMETLKAQAIAARTYALYRNATRGDKEYDLTSDIYSQVYGGKISERMKTNRAVNLTKGKVLKFEGSIFPAYYHATCGGYTENASKVWDIDLPPLRGVKCGFCRHSPHYSWRYNTSLGEIEKRLNAKGYKIRNLKRVAPEGKTASGRIDNIRLIGDGELILSADAFRLAMGPNDMRSAAFEVKERRKRLYFYGRGWGHGVGMCQWGAFFLGLRRYKAGRILKYYYPGARVSKI